MSPTDSPPHASSSDALFAIESSSIESSAQESRCPPPITIDALGDYPFERTRKLLDPITPVVAQRLNLTIGQPKVPAPALIREAINRDNQWRLYPPIPGTKALQDAIRDWLAHRYDLDTMRDQYAVEPTCGSREGLFLLAMVTRFLNRGKKRLIGVPNPGYAVYAGSAKIAGATLLPLHTPQGAMPPPDQLDPQTLRDLQLVFLCHPDNPSGHMQSSDTLAAWIEAARQYGFILVSDECYSELYLDTPPVGILQIAAKSGEFSQVVCVNSLSKRSSAAGIRSGMMAGDPEIIALVREIKAYAGNRMPLGLQHASSLLWRDEAHVNTVRAHYQYNYRLCNAYLSSVLLPTPLQAGMFLWLSVKDDLEAAKTLWHQAGIRTIPGRYLCLQGHEHIGQGHLRVAIVDDAKTLEPALKTIKNLLG